MNNSVKQYLNHHAIKPGDVVVINRKEIALFNHYAIYIGQGHFIANLRPGLQLISETSIWQYLDNYALTRVRRHTGTDSERHVSVQRALELFKSGEQSGNYSLVFNNCEHFANYVQYGQRFSLQAQVAGAGALTSGLIMLGSKDKDVQLVGFLALIAGAGTLLLENLGNNENYGRETLPLAYIPKQIR